MKEKIVVTGGSGFIGTNMIERLILKGFTVWNFDIKTPKIKERESIWKQINLCDKEVLRSSLESLEPDYLIDFAARTDLNGNSIDDYSDNFVSVRNIIDCIKDIGSIKKIIITSSMLVCEGGYQPKNQFDYKPTTFYGESKVLVEKIVWDSKLKCDWAIIRPTSIWGPWFGTPYRDFFNLVIANRYCHIGDRSCTKTYGYVGNAVAQIEAIMLADTRDLSNKVYYIGDYDPYPIDVWANEIANELGQKILVAPYWAIYLAAKVGDVLKKANISFPMTSFRLRNMTTDNIVDTEGTKAIAGDLEFSRIQGIKQTLEWIRGDSN